MNRAGLEPDSRNLMVPASRVPCRARHCQRGRDRMPPLPGAAFTLVELLVVIAVVATLTAITLGIASGVRTRAGIDRARGELAVLCTALENYHRIYRDYPPATNPTDLLAALSGRLTPDGTISTRPPLLDLAVFTLNDAQDAFVDPWGQPYRYVPITQAGRRTYQLYSSGPDGEESAANDNIVAPH